MDNEVKRTQKQIIEELVETIGSYSELHKVLSILDRKATPILNKDSELKPRLDNTMFYDTICYLLENKPTPQEAFAYTALLYNKGEDWMNIAKNTQLKPYIHKEVSGSIISSKEPTVSKAVKSIVDNQLDLKGAMTTSKTPNQSVRRIHKLIKVSDRLDALEERVGNIEQRQDTAEFLLKAVVDMSCREALKIEAKKLIREGNLTRKQISDVTGLSVRVLVNYAKEVKQEDDS